MLKVKWKIGKKPRGNYRAPLEFNIVYEDSEELKLRPHLVFQREYHLPGTIYLGKEKAIRDGEGACRVVNRIKISIDAFVEQPEVVHHKFLLDPNICPYTCQSCRAYLEWRPGRPDYSDYESVFRQVAEDLIAAWRVAVGEAAASEELDLPEVVVTPDDLAAPNQAAEETKAAKRVTRKIKV